MKKKLGALFLFVLLVVFAFLSYRWVKERMDYAITDAVFVKAQELTNLGFQVQGKVIELKKDVGEQVKEGEILALLDGSDYQLNFEGLSAKVESLKAQRQALLLQLKRLEKELNLSVESAHIASEEISKREKVLLAQLSEVKLNKEKAQKDLERFQNLYQRGLIPLSKYEESQIHYQSLAEKERSLEASLEELKLSYTRSLKEEQKAKAKTLLLEELKSQIQALSKEIQSLEAQKQLSYRQLGYTKLIAPFDGVIAKRFVSTGDIVKAGQPVYAIVKKDSLYVEVLLEEDKLRGVKVGSKVIFRPDAFKDVEFIGRVEEISPASSATFALVPRDVSAGEFTKVVQRIPIKVKLESGPMELLRVGMGGSVKIQRYKDESK